eukprot:Nk52_evm62s266 gene=Nk52_evmTU62s266
MGGPAGRGSGGKAESAEEWLGDQLSLVLGFSSPEMVQHIGGLGGDREVEEYLVGLLGDTGETRSLVKGYVERRKKTRVGSSARGEGGSTGQKKKKGKHVEKGGAGGIEGRPQYGKRAAVKEKKIAPQITDTSFYSQKTHAPTGGASSRPECTCLASRHPLVNNCIECGRIVCEAEGYGPCLTCGQLVLTREQEEIVDRDSNKSRKFLDQLLKDIEKKYGSGARVRAEQGGSVDREASAAAVRHKDKLIEYDRTSAKRTQVIDDESDYYQSHESNRWLSKEQRALLKHKEESLRSKQEEARRTVRITLDFAGRKIIDDKVEENMVYGDGSVEQEINNTLRELDMNRESEAYNAGLLSSAAHAKDLSFVPSATALWRGGGVSALKGNQQNREEFSRVQDLSLIQMTDKGMCMSMHQPYASLLVLGIKRDEGRGWYSSHRGRLWIAAAAKEVTEEEIASVESFYREYYGEMFGKEGGSVEFPETYPTGCLLGCVDVVDVLPQDAYTEALKERYDGNEWKRHHESQSPFVFVCESPQQLRFPFAMKGDHKIFRLEPEVHNVAKSGLMENEEEDATS